MSLDLSVWSLIITLALITTVPMYHIVRGRVARREAARLSRSLSASHAIFTALEHVPDSLLQRDLRRGLVVDVRERPGQCRALDLAAEETGRRRGERRPR